MNSLKLALAATTSLFSVGLITPVLAQTTDGKLDEIVVKARKKDENIQDVPLSVATLSGEKLDVLQSSGLDVRFMSARVPSLQIESSFGRTFPRFYIRGLGNTDFDLNGSQPVSFVYDDVVLENPVLKGLPIFDVAQVEVLRGPQGTLFGRNTPAGVVKVDTVRPDGARKGYLNASYATYDTINMEGAYSFPVSDTVAARVSALFQHRSDWVENLADGPENELGGYRDYALRGQVQFTPNERLSANLNIHGWGSDGTARLFRANIIETGGGLVSDFNREAVFYDGENKQKVRGLGAQATIDYDLGTHDLTSISAWKSVDVFSRGDIDGGFGAAFLGNSQPGIVPFDAESADGLPEHDQYTQEIRLTSKLDGPMNYTVGGYYFYEDLFIESFNFASLAPGNPQNGYATQNQETTSIALFGTVDYAASDRLDLQAGVRVTSEEKDFSAERLVSPLSGFGVPNVSQPDPQSSDEEFVSWNISASYALNDLATAFARIAQGNRAPSFQGRLLFGDVITMADTETLTSFEAGIKASSADDRARVSATAFYYTVDDQQLTAVGGDANFNQLVNAEEVVGGGFELEGEFAPDETSYLTAGLSYNSTEINDDGLAIQPCGAPCTVLDPAGTVPGTVSIDGNSLPHAPEWIFNVTGRKAFPMASGGELFVFGDVVHESEKNFFLYESEEFKSDSFTESGLRFGYRNADGSLEAAVFGRNIFDEEALRGAIDFNNLTGFVNEPAIWGAELKTTF